MNYICFDQDKNLSRADTSYHFPTPDIEARTKRNIRQIK